MRKGVSKFPDDLNIVIHIAVDPPGAESSVDLSRECRERAIVRKKRFTSPCIALRELIHEFDLQELLNPASNNDDSRSIRLIGERRVESFEAIKRKRVKFVCVTHIFWPTYYSTQNLPLTGQSSSQRYAFYDSIPLLSRGDLKKRFDRNQSSS
jgi:hypothetical protein